MPTSKTSSAKPTASCTSRHLTPQEAERLAAITAELTRRRYGYAKDSLAEFIKQAVHIIEPDITLLWNWPLDYLCEWLECVTFGLRPLPKAAAQIGLLPVEGQFGPACDYSLRPLVINQPPGTMKSLTVTVLWPCWDWIHRPSDRLAFVSYAHDLSSVHSLARRQVLESLWYQSGLEEWQSDPFRLTGDQNVKTHYDNTKRGRMFSTSTGGMITGTHYDRIIVDDPVNPQEAASDAKRERANRFHSETLVKRVRDPKRSQFVVVMQRLHEHDYTHHVMQQRGVGNIVLPGICEEDTTYTFPRTGREVHRRGGGFEMTTDRRLICRGDILWEEREGAAELESDMIAMGSHVFAGQIQQRPRPREGGFFQGSWFEIVDDYPRSARAVRAWDLAATEAVPGVDPDSTAGVKVAESDGVFYVLDLKHFRGGPKQVRDTVKQTAQTDGRGVPIRMAQDPGQAGKDQIMDYRLHVLRGFTVYSQTVTGNKEIRAQGWNAAAEAGNVKLVRGEWNATFIADVERFGEKGHNDIVDAMSDAYTHLTTKRRRKAVASST